MKPCPDTPEYMWLSDTIITRSTGHHERQSKMPWTRELLAFVGQMRKAGSTWAEVCQALHERTGIWLSEGGVSDYVERYQSGEQ